MQVNACALLPPIYFIIQSNEVGGSYYMEKEGLSRSIMYLQEQNLTIGMLNTDRHRSIATWVQEVLPQIIYIVIYFPTII